MRGILENSTEFMSSALPIHDAPGARGAVTLPKVAQLHVFRNESESDERAEHRQPQEYDGDEESGERESYESDSGESESGESESDEGAEQPQPHTLRDDGEYDDRAAQRRPHVFARDNDAEESAEQRRLPHFRPPRPSLAQPTLEQIVNAKPRRRRYWLIAACAIGALAVAMGAGTSFFGLPNRYFALATVPTDAVSPAAAPVAAANESETPSKEEGGVSPPNWANRAAQLRIALSTAVLSSTDATDGPDPGSVVAANVVSPQAAAAVPAAAAAAPAAAAPAEEGVRGVTDKEILFGMAAPFSGASRELGRQMKIGVETAFDQINDSGGINGRRLRLMAADDGYEPTRTIDAMHELYDKDQVFGFVGNVGTPTGAVALPFALDHRALFFGAFTGASLFRRDPPDRYVFNYRASYAEETDAVVRYLVKVRRLQPNQIVVFAQQDAYGDSGYAGVSKAVRSLPGDYPDIVRLGYKRNTVDVQDAVNQLQAFKGRIKAVVMVASYRAAAKFIEKTRDLYPSLIYTNVSFVGSTALADELMLLGPRYASGAIVTQVVPAVNSYASIILKYKTALAKYFPGESADYVSLEGYIDASILAEAVKRAGADINTEKLVDELERMHDFDMGLGTLVTFSPNEHQGSHKVWGTQLDEAGHYQAIDLQ
jgi:branched-chain amino acid transport system substrate-binding protein